MYMFKENPVDAFDWVVDSVQFIDERNKGDERVEVNLSGIYKEGATYNLFGLDNMQLYIEDRMNGREGEKKYMHDRFEKEFEEFTTSRTSNRIRNNGMCITNKEITVRHSFNAPEIKNVVFNPPATIVFWDDGTKTVVKCQNNEEFDPEKGITMAFFKKLHGNTGHYFEEIKKWTKNYVNKEETEGYDPCESCIWLDSDK